MERGSFWREDVPLLCSELDCQRDPASSALCATNGAGKKQTRALLPGIMESQNVLCREGPSKPSTSIPLPQAAAPSNRPGFSKSYLTWP